MTVTPLREVHRPPARDLAAAERAAAAFLTALGVDLTGDGSSGTPERMARAYAELLTPREFELTTFRNDEGYDELVMARSIPIRSICEHHLLPFVGVAHVVEVELRHVRARGHQALARGRTPLGDDAGRALYWAVRAGGSAPPVAPLEKESPSRQGAAVFENSTACAPGSNPDPVCVQVRSADPSRARRT